MLTIQNYVRAGSLEEAYALCQKKNNVVLGGMLWLKMQRNRVDTAIDLSGLGLDQIEETDSEYRLGAMVTLRQLELHPGLDRLTQGAMAESVRHIVGVQFRNLATVGGSVFGRFGFSDVLTLLLALEARVVLDHSPSSHAPCPGRRGGRCAPWGPGPGGRSPLRTSRGFWPGGLPRRGPRPLPGRRRGASGSGATSGAAPNTAKRSARCWSAGACWPWRGSKQWRSN